ncbi:MAG: ATP synthase F1 subunit epsilon [Planctomycetota bacterium]|jgi:F-type H+-transporting ATPase subunit epsilon
MHLAIITPERTVMETDNAEHVLLPAENGEVGILPGHIHMVCSLQIGRIRVDMADEIVSLATSGGYAEVVADNVVILAETAEKAAEINVSRAQAARDKARQYLGRRDATVDDAARAALMRALNRLRVAEGS